MSIRTIVMPAAAVAMLSSVSVPSGAMPAGIKMNLNDMFKGGQ